MSKGNQFENELMLFTFNATAMPSYGANIYIRLHTDDPGEAGTGATNEANYTGYAPVAVARDNSGFTVSNNQAINFAEITFPECTGGTNTLKYASACTAAGQILYSGALLAYMDVSNGHTPRFPAGTLVFQED
jgi:hypothetical protein